MRGRLSLAITKELYWAVQAAVVAGLLLLLMIPLVRWPIAWGFVGIIELCLILSRLRDAGQTLWVPLIAVGAIAGAIWLFGRWARAEDLRGSGDGAGLLWAMLSFPVIGLTAIILIIWPGMLESGRRDERRIG